MRCDLFSCPCALCLVTNSTRRLDENYPLKQKRILLGGAVCFILRTDALPMLLTRFNWSVAAVGIKDFAYSGICFP